MTDSQGLRLHRGDATMAEEAVLLSMYVMYLETPSGLVRMEFHAETQAAAEGFARTFTRDTSNKVKLVRLLTKALIA